MAISNLINPPNNKIKPVTYSASRPEIKACAKTFLDNLEPGQKNKFIKMVKQGVHIGSGISSAYGVPHDEFMCEIHALIV